MAPEAQQAAIQRLMLTGSTPAQIAEWTGLAPQDVSRAAVAPFIPPRSARKAKGAQSR
jgi:hypothetical protein